MEERWLSVKEIATHIGVGPDTVYKLISRKRLPAHKLGKLWKFRTTEVDEWIKNGHATDREQAIESNEPQSKEGELRRE